jgi:hypothetical protein
VLRRPPVRNLGFDEERILEMSRQAVGAVDQFATVLVGIKPGTKVPTSSGRRGLTIDVKVGEPRCP